MMPQMVVVVAVVVTNTSSGPVADPPDSFHHLHVLLALSTSFPVLAHTTVHQAVVIQPLHPA